VEMTDYAVFIKMDHWLILYRILMSFVSFYKEYINTMFEKVHFMWYTICDYKIKKWISECFCL